MADMSKNQLLISPHPMNPDHCKKEKCLLKSHFFRISFSFIKVMEKMSLANLTIESLKIISIFGGISKRIEKDVRIIQSIKGNKINN